MNMIFFNHLFSFNTKAYYIFVWMSGPTYVVHKLVYSQGAPLAPARPNERGANGTSPFWAQMCSGA